MENQSLGRVFCVTGKQTTQQNHNQTAPVSKAPSRPTSALPWTGSSDTDSNTSGYLSSSSFESSGEERRLVPNEQKVVRVWDRWGERFRVSTGPKRSTPVRVASCPKSSTPKAGSEDVKPGHPVGASGNTNKSCLLVIKKNLTQKTVDKTFLEDSFWDITTPHVQKSSSEGDVRKGDKSSKTGSKPKKTVMFADERDAGLEINPSQNSRNPAINQDWKRRPFLTQSTSHEDLHMKSTSGNSNYRALPRYRVKVNADTNLVSQICRSVADFADEGKPVDESMTEFLSNVDKDNLASFLKFYDKVTSSTDYERARRNPRNYEAVYY